MLQSVIIALLRLQSPAKYRYNHRAWLDEQEKEEGLPSQSATSSTSGAQPMKHPLAGLRKVVKYPEKLGEKISTQVRVRQEQKQVGQVRSYFYWGREGSAVSETESDGC